MVVGHSHKYIYFAVPRTASLSLCRFFIDDYGGHMTGPYHGVQPPPGYDECLSYRRIVSVRDPYQRVLSWWWVRCVGTKDSALKGWSFERFMEDAISKKRRLLAGERIAMGRDRVVAGEGQSAIYLPQAWWIEHINPDHVIRFERLKKDVERLPFVKRAALQHKHRSTRSKNLTKRAKSLVEDFEGETFESLYA